MKPISLSFFVLFFISVNGQTTYLTSEEEKIPVGRGTLYGTLFTPVNPKKFPVVLLIAGSGPTDRDGNNIVLPGKNNSLLQLADSLARHGIGTLRYDKRGVGKSRSDTIMKEESLTIDTIASDAEAMYNWLKARGFNEIYIAGHSEGSLIGMMVALKVNPSGFISIAGAGRKIREILQEQLAGRLPSQLDSMLRIDLDSLERGLSVTFVHPSLMSLLRPSVQPYMKSWLKLDPQKIMAQLKCPALIVQGSKDIQVSILDAHNLHAAMPDSRLLVVTNMNHIFKQVTSDDRNDNLKTYSDPSYPVMGELISGIVEFVKQPNK
ncbi:MAG TPA: alpha/beta hydrolase [Chitinophagaceae bacterium]|nr:alpha/beta hydrolase [Chitinophagaceae bacterium]